jgi:predicted ferric reductase
MKYSFRRAFLWLGIYILLCLVPLLIATIGSIPEQRDFWIEFGVALGFLGLGIFALQFVFSGRFTKIAASFGMDNVHHFHRKMGIIAFVFVLMHPITLILANPEFIGYFDPRINALRAIALSFATVSLIFLTASSLWRISFGLNYEMWRLVHGLLSLALVFIGTVHVLQVSHYIDTLWKQVLLALLMGGSMYLVIHTRIIRPWKNRKKPYKVINVQKERDESWTLELNPQNHKRMTFETGQFAWLTINDSPFSMQQHPFTIASSERDESLLFTAKATGDFTSTWEDIELGTKVFLEGPFGSFTPKENSNLFLIMGGIGVTPAMSMLRTLRDKKDNRKITLIYANENWENITFREELEEIKAQLNLKIIHVLNEPDDDWKGETGIVDYAFLKKHLPENPNDYMFYICGPEPMMDEAEIALRDLEIDWRHIYTERFNIV